jgi:hypothetical protein
MAKTVVGLMDNIDEAQSVVRDLVASGIDRGDIGFMANQKQAVPSSAQLNESEGSNAASGALAGAGAGAALGGLAGVLLSVAPLAIPGIGPIIAAGPIAAALTGAGIGAVAGGLIGGLTNLGVPEEEAHYYAEGVRRGGILVTVAAESDAQADKAATIMRQHGAADIDQRATEWKKQGWKGRFDAELQQDERTIPVTQEELAVGKREVSQGAVRVYSRVSEQPVRAVEEVKVGKKKSQKKQAVEDTVRRTDVEVQRNAGRDRGARAYHGPERRMNRTPWPGEERRRAA